MIQSCDTNSIFVGRHATDTRESAIGEPVGADSTGMTRDDTRFFSLVADTNQHRKEEIEKKKQSRGCNRLNRVSTRVKTINHCLTFTPLACPIPVEIRLKALLKSALRIHKFRCVDAREVQP